MSTEPTEREFRLGEAIVNEQLRSLNAEARVAELEAALADRDATIVRVRALHKVTLVPSPGEPFKVCLECLDDNGANNIDWPCPTIRALDGGAS